MSEEEIKEEFSSLDEKKLSKKVREAMLEIVVNSTEEAEFCLFKHLMEKFSKAELAHVAKVFVAKKLADEVQSDPEIRGTLASIRALAILKRDMREN